MIYVLARIFFFLVGFGLTVIGFVYTISYLNLLALGYNFFDYVHFISGRIECIYAVIGIVIVSLAIFLPGGKKYELHL